jgi:flagellar motility protein MotE (MotC chaperone)
VLLLRGFLFLAVIFVFFYSVFDVIRSEASRVHHLHKLIWLVLVLLFSPIGALAWLFLGRPEPLGSRMFEAKKRPARAPDDSPEFLAGLSDEIKRRRSAERLRATEENRDDIDEEIRRLEEELRRRSEEERGDDRP